MWGKTDRRRENCRKTRGKWLWNTPLTVKKNTCHIHRVDRPGRSWRFSCPNYSRYCTLKLKPGKCFIKNVCCKIKSSYMRQIKDRYCNRLFHNNISFFFSVWQNFLSFFCLLWTRKYSLRTWFYKTRHGCIALRMNVRCLLYELSRYTTYVFYLSIAHWTGRWWRGPDRPVVNTFLHCETTFHSSTVRRYR